MLPDAVAQNPQIIALAEQLPARFSTQALLWTAWSSALLPKHVESVCRYLKQNEGFVRLSAVTGVDWWPREPRFEVVYFLHSLAHNARLRLSVRVAEGEPWSRYVTSGAGRIGTSAKCSTCSESNSGIIPTWSAS